MVVGAPGSRRYEQGRCDGVGANLQHHGSVAVTGGRRRPGGVAIRLAGLLLLASVGPARAAEQPLHDFRDGLQGWHIPEWCLRDESYVGRGIAHATAGHAAADGSLALSVDFGGMLWQRAMVAVDRRLDLRGRRSLVFHTWLPADAPSGIAPTVFVVTGTESVRVESEAVFPLTPGRWTRAEVSLVPGEDGWRRPFDRGRVTGLMLAVEKYRGEPLEWRGVVRFDDVTLRRVE